MKLFWKDRDRKRAVDRLDEVVAVPPSAAEPINQVADVDALILAGPAAILDADTFRQAGWSFVPVEPETADADRRAVYIDDAGKLYIDGRRLTVRFSATSSPQKISKTLGAHGLVMERKLGFAPNSYIVSPAGESGSDIVKLANEISQEPDVDYATPSFLEAIGARRRVG